MPPHENGADHEERDEAARAHADFERIPRAEIPRVAYVSAHLAKWGMQRYSSVVVEMDSKLGRVAVEVGAVARTNERLANLAEARVEALDSKLDARCDRIEQAIASRFSYNADASARLPSITDELEGENTAVRAVALRVRAKDAEAFEEVKAQLAQIQQEKHDAEVRAKTLAEKKAEDDKASEARENTLKRRIAILIGLGTILGALATAGAYAYARVELRQSAPANAPPK